MLGLAVSQADAQGFNISKQETTVAEQGRNQRLGALRLDYNATSGNIDVGTKVTVSYGVPITTATFTVGGEDTNHLSCVTITCETTAVKVAKD